MQWSRRWSIHQPFDCEPNVGAIAGAVKMREKMRSSDTIGNDGQKSLAICESSGQWKGFGVVLSVVLSVRPNFLILCLLMRPKDKGIKGSINKNKNL